MIKCISCRFAKVDKDASDSKWDAYECSNPKSQYHKALLNTTPNGGKLKRISWSGCPHGKRKVKSNAKKTTETL
ncbi:hypothetical protein [Senegalia sp. (in: firmicutes)]|uniref:hypothetical protein n=1 Tax=Senegalia sp. (in: firmicutes) TaxID=1924098 RepID=UPI003F987E06